MELTATLASALHATTLAKPAQVLPAVQSALLGTCSTKISVFQV